MDKRERDEKAVTRQDDGSVWVPIADESGDVFAWEVTYPDGHTAIVPRCD